MAAILGEIYFECKPEKPKFRYTKSPFGDGWFWMPMNYEAETIHLMKVYGHTNNGRQFKK